MKQTNKKMLEFPIMRDVFFFLNEVTLFKNKTQKYYHVIKWGQQQTNTLAV